MKQTHSMFLYCEPVMHEELGSDVLAKNSIGCLQYTIPICQVLSPTCHADVMAGGDLFV